MKLHKILTTVLLLIYGISHANEDPVIKTIYIASEKVTCMGVAKRECLQVKWDKAEKDWQNFYSYINGFTFIKGYEYVLKVRVEKVENPPADASSVKYTLLQLISKTKVNSIIKKPFTSNHSFIAQLTDIKYNTCMARTALCPDRCGNSGEFANFKVLEYKHFLVNGEAGTEKLENYSIQISDFHKKNLKKSYIKTLRSLKPNDKVLIDIDFVYDTTKSNVETIVKINKIIKIKK